MTHSIANLFYSLLFTSSISFYHLYKFISIQLVQKLHKLQNPVRAIFAQTENRKLSPKEGLTGTRFAYFNNRRRRRHLHCSLLIANFFLCRLDLYESQKLSTRSRLQAPGYLAPDAKTVIRLPFTVRHIERKA